MKYNGINVWLSFLSSPVRVFRVIKMASPRIFIVISAYNESSRLGNVLETLHNSNYEHIVVVDDGSRDKTAQVAAKYPCHVLRHGINRGQGAGLQTGISYALRQNADIIVTFDADGQHDAAEIPLLVAPLLSGEAEITLGSRFLGKAVSIPWSRKVLLYGGRIFTRLTSGLKLTDCHNGFRAISRSAAEKIHLSQDRMAHASEFYDQIAKHHLRYKEIPVTITYNADVMAKGQNNLQSLHVLFHYLFQKAFGNP